MRIPVSLLYIPFYTRRASFERKVDCDKVEYEGKDRYIEIDYARKLICKELEWLPCEVFDNWIKRMISEGIIFKGRYTIGEKKIILNALIEELKGWYDNQVS